MLLCFACLCLPLLVKAYYYSLFTINSVEYKQATGEELDFFIYNMTHGISFSFKLIQIVNKTNFPPETVQGNTVAKFGDPEE